MNPHLPAPARDNRLFRRVNSVHGNHKRIAAGALTIGVLTLLAKAFVAAREMAIAWRYGVSSTVDAYQLSVTIVTWVPMLIAGVLGVVLVPRVVRLDRRKADRDAFLAEFNGTAVVLGAGVALLTYVAAPEASRLMAAQLDAETVRLTILIVQRLSPIALFMILAGYLTARLQARERFGYTLTEAIPALMIAIFVIAPFPAGSVTPLILGSLVGYIAQLVILLGLVAKGDPPIGRVALRHRSQEWETFYGPLLIMVLGQLVLTATNPIDQLFAAGLGTGAVATLGYANRIITLFSGLAMVVIGRALLPVLSNAVASGSLALGRRHALQWGALMFAAGVIGSAFLWLLAPELVKLLFQRGAFQASATAAVSGLLRYGILQLPFFFGGIALVQWVAAVGRFGAIASITSAALAVKVILNFLLVRHFGLPTLMISSALMYVVTSVLLLRMIAKGAAPIDSVDETAA